jgi:hypothetical protein
VRAVRSGLTITSLAALLVALLTGCTPSGSGGDSPTPSPSTRTIVSTRTRTVTPPPPSGPETSGPTTVHVAHSCPFIAEQSATNKSGMRLDKITVLKSGGKVVGCRFYGLQHPTLSCDETCLKGERLPGPHQPAIEIRTYRYPSKQAVHNALALSAKGGANVEQLPIAGSTGLCFQINFYPKDNGTDWACSFAKGTKLVVVRTTISPSPAKSVQEVADEVGRHV